MTDHGKILKLARQLNIKSPLFGENVHRTACRKLAADKSAKAVPFLVSALANSDKEVRNIAEDGLKSLSDPESIEALLLGYVFTKEDILQRILTELGRDVPETPHPPPSQATDSSQEVSPAEEAWRFQNSRDGTVLAFVPEGTFLAGEEKFSVHLPPYYLSLTCVTNAQYAGFLNKSRPAAAKLALWINLPRAGTIQKENEKYVVEAEKENLPAVWITWEGAAAYCKWAGLRLPTELEWEKGARGVEGRLYPWGDEWAEGRPTHNGDERKPDDITNVCAYPSARSPYGLYQMIGNIYEWCSDWYEQEAYRRYAQGDISPLRRGEHRMLRGGPWRFGTPATLRTEYRKSTVWRGGTLLCGFRCAKSV